MKADEENRSALVRRERKAFEYTPTLAKTSKLNFN